MENDIDIKSIINYLHKYSETYSGSIITPQNSSTLFFPKDTPTTLRPSYIVYENKIHLFNPDQGNNCPDGIEAIHINDISYSIIDCIGQIRQAVALILYHSRKPLELINNLKDIQSIFKSSFANYSIRSAQILFKNIDCCSIPEPQNLNQIEKWVIEHFPEFYEENSQIVQENCLRFFYLGVRESFPLTIFYPLLLDSISFKEQTRETYSANVASNASTVYKFRLQPQKNLLTLPYLYIHPIIFNKAPFSDIINYKAGSESTIKIKIGTEIIQDKIRFNLK